MNNTNRKEKTELKNIESFEIVYPNAAGIDIGAKEHWVCVPPSKAKENVRKFGTFTCDLYEIAKWLTDCGVTTVAMESTGVYWIPLYCILEEKGLEVHLINAKHIKRVPCRGKTDRIDCQWICKLHACGLLTSSFRPEHDMRKIRTLIRHRDRLIQNKSQSTLRMQKSLELMNLKLPEVISDITGKTGMAIIKGILQGNHNPEKLSELKDPRIKASKDTIVKALQGDYREELLFTLKQSLDAVEFFHQQIVECDLKIESLLRQLEFEKSPSSQQQVSFSFDNSSNPSPRKRSFRKKSNAPDFDVHSYLKNITNVDLMAIPGIKDSALNIISEIGLDMSKFPTAKHFTSWLGLAPNRKVSGGKTLSSRTRSVRSPANKLFRNAASTLRNSKTFLGDFYRKIRSRHGEACAITAVARKLANIFYLMLKRSSPYLELGSGYLSQLRHDKIINNIHKQAKSLGYTLVLTKLDS